MTMGPPASKFIRLPDEINLSKASLAEQYRQATITVPGRDPPTRLTLHGEPILFGVTIPKTCPNVTIATEWLRLLLDDVGRTALEKSGLVPLRPAVAVGSDVPAALRRLCNTLPGTA